MFRFQTHSKWEFRGFPLNVFLRIVKGAKHDDRANNEDKKNERQR